jgi:LysR family glycine cleavage system transcriptional activator
VHELREDSWERWAAALGVDPPRPKKLIRFDSMSAVARAAERGLGIALVAWPTSRDWFTSGALVRLFDIEIEVGDEFYLVHRHDDVKRNEVRFLAEWIVKEFESFA